MSTSRSEPVSQGSIAAGRRPSVVVVTGLSGAGKSTALRTLEDLGFFCIDNLPTILAPQAVSLCEHGGMGRLALGIDVRVRSFFGEIGGVLGTLENDGQRDVQVLFLDASDETLLHRFSESRRRHPLDLRGGDGPVPVLEGVKLERERLAPLRARATRLLDTTTMSVHELRRAVIAHFGPGSSGTRMTTRIVSFGFKYGAPVDADLVFDVRFLENPFFVPELRQKPGTAPEVRDFVLGLPEARDFLAKTLDLLEFMLPKFEREGKSYLTIAIGCTGGRHRSVVMGEEIASELTARTGTQVMLQHRDVARRSVQGELESMLPPPEYGSDSEVTAQLSPIPPLSEPIPAAPALPSVPGDHL